jgi:hypothetical protein
MLVTGENISDIMTTALEGGSNHWVDSLEGELGEHRYFSDAIAAGLEFKVLIDDYPSQKINRGKVVNGLDMYEKKNGKPFDMEFCETDAGDADEVLQYALFGELVFG